MPIPPRRRASTSSVPHAPPRPARPSPQSETPEPSITALVQRAVSGRAPVPAADVLRLQRTLGNRAVGRLLARGGSGAAGSLQRYVEAPDVRDERGNFPAGGRVSENGNIVWAGKQEVYATRNVIDAGNEGLAARSEFVLEAGEQTNFDLLFPSLEPGFTTITFADYHRVHPRANPQVQGTHPVSPLNPVAGEASEERAKKHERYMSLLVGVLQDYGEFWRELVAQARRLEATAVKGGAKKNQQMEVLDADPEELAERPGGMEILMLGSGWLRADPMRRDLLVLGVQTRLLDFKDRPGYTVENLAKDLKDVEVALMIFVAGERERGDSIALPTDCGQVVTLIVGGSQHRSTAQDLFDNPAIGSNYYARFPKLSVGWNDHWAGVVMKDGRDNVTLESAGGLSFSNLGKQTWWMEMYGTRVADQTFRKRIHRIHVERTRKLLESEDNVEADLGMLEKLSEEVESW